MLDFTKIAIFRFWRIHLQESTGQFIFFVNDKLNVHIKQFNAEIRCAKANLQKNKSFEILDEENLTCAQIPEN